MLIIAPKNLQSENIWQQRSKNHSNPKINNLWIFSVTILLSLVTVLPAFCYDDPLTFIDRASTIDFLLENAISRKLISGGVVLIGNRNGIIYTAARGRTTSEPSSQPLSTTTLFDIASLTKVFATAPAIMKLLQDGQISLMDPITRWFPELNDSGREETTILNLLTHTSGLHDVSINSTEPMNTLLSKATLQPDTPISGSRFSYADINFILLAELVQRASGIPFDRFCKENLYRPLGMDSTGFLPQNGISKNIAPTRTKGSELLAGIVQDENARLLGGVAGHAGLFSNAVDLSRFATMMLHNTENYEKSSIFNPQTMAQMTAPYFYNNGKVIRGLGWDIYSPYSSPRGNSFSAMSFGHTGYSGSSVWIDPEKDLYVLLLTIRLNYRNKHAFNQLRSDISTIASALFSSLNKSE